MMTSLDRRLRRIEARRENGVSFFVAWGRTPGEAQQARHVAEESGAVRPGIGACLVWPRATPVPQSRWIGFGRDRAHEIPADERVVLRDAIHVELTTRGVPYPSRGEPEAAYR